MNRSSFLPRLLGLGGVLSSRRRGRPAERAEEIGPPSFGIRRLELDPKRRRTPDVNLNDAAAAGLAFGQCRVRDRRLARRGGSHGEPHRLASSAPIEQV